MSRYPAIITGILLGLTVAAAEPPKAEPERPPERNGLFQRLDADGNGKLSKDEFLGLFEKLVQGGEIAKEVVGGQFENLDADKDGTLSRDEFKKVIFSILPDELKPEEMLKRIRDPNGGIRIDVEEFRKLIEQLRRNREERK